MEPIDPAILYERTERILNSMILDWQEPPDVTPPHQSIVRARNPGFFQRLVAARVRTRKKMFGVQTAPLILSESDDGQLGQIPAEQYGRPDQPHTDSQQAAIRRLIGRELDRLARSPDSAPVLDAIALGGHTLIP
jgi:hypothetical protein